MRNTKRKMQPDRLNVFISSAQNNEKGFIWTDIRKKVADTLSEYDFIQPFIIEETGSVIPSAQYFMSKAHKADMIVFLVKGVLRAGTLVEYSIARNYNIPILVYFLADSKPERSVIDFKQRLMQDDPSTYHSVQDIDRIDEYVGRDVINCMVNAYQGNRNDFSVDKKVANQLLAGVKDLLINSDAQSKTDIKKFDSCYNYLFDLLDLRYFINACEESELHHFGCLLIGWLITSCWEINERDIKEFLRLNTIDASAGKWLRKRWSAIQAANNDDLEKAFREEKLALKYAKETHEKSWIIDDILIDCRNLEIMVDAQYRRRKVRPKYQEELEARTSVICYPALDRYLTDIYDCIERDEFRVKTASIYSELFGSNLSYALTDLANYLFTAAMYGSYTHIRRTQLILPVIMERYYSISGDDSFAFMALRQRLLSGETKDFELYVNHSWDACYAYITKNADELWKMTDRVHMSNRDSMRLTVIALFGPYLTNKVFSGAGKYLYDYSSDVYWNNSERYFDAILKNLQRLNANRVVQVICQIIAEKRYSVGYKITRIICNLHLEKVSDRNLRKLNCILCDKLSYLISVNGDPCVIRVLTDYKKEIFGDLLTLEVNNLPGVRRALNRMDPEISDLVLIMKEEIDSARTQFIENSRKGVYTLYGHDPYSVIGNILRRESNPEGVMELLVREFIPLSIEVLESEAAVQLKDSCTACLCDAVSFFHKNKTGLPEQLIHAMTIIDISKGSDLFRSGSRKAFGIRVMMAKWLAGIIGSESLFSWCLEYENYDDKEKIALLDCIEKYLFLHREEQDKTDPVIVALVLQSVSEKRLEVRRTAVRCLAWIAGKDKASVIIETLKNAAYDSSEYIRMDLLYLCRNNRIPVEVSSGLIHVLQKDPNFNIRNIAKETV